MEGGERQGQFALSKHRCLLLSSEASHQSRPWALGGDSRKDAPLCSETGWIVYKATRSLLKITVSNAGLVDFRESVLFKRLLSRLRGVTEFSKDVTMSVIGFQKGCALDFLPLCYVSGGEFVWKPSCSHVFEYALHAGFIAQLRLSNMQIRW